MGAFPPFTSPDLVLSLNLNSVTNFEMYFDHTYLLTQFFLVQYTLAIVIYVGYTVYREMTWWKRLTRPGKGCQHNIATMESRE